MRSLTHMIGLMLLVLFLLPNLMFGQRLLHNYKRGLFVEVFGNSVGYSLNFEQTLVNNTSVGITARAGFGATSVDFYSPWGLQIVLIPGDHHLLISPTATARMALIAPFDFDKSDTFLHLSTGFGYRYQSRNSRWFFQAQFVPGFQLDPTRTQVTETPPEFQTRIGGAVGFKL